MGIIKREKKNGVTVFHLKKDMSDAEIAKKKATFCKRPKLIINYDADVIVFQFGKRFQNMTT